MWNRKLVKAKGKESFKRNYWYSVLVGFIYTLFFAGSGVSYRSSGDEVTQTLNTEGVDPTILAAAVAIILGAVAVGMVIMTIVDIFLLNPLEVGCNRFFLVNHENNAELSELKHGFTNNYLNVVLAIFLKNLFIVIGLCLFLIPGIIMCYSYKLVPYILADDPTISASEAVKKSRMMMKGHKWSTFVYDLSFLGWFILDAFTLGILGVFYVHPYKLSSDAALYQAIKENQ